MNIYFTVAICQTGGAADPTIIIMGVMLMLLNVFTGLI